MIVDDLTPRELEIARIVAEGLSTREAAARLFVSPKTVESHLGRIYRKLELGSRSQLTRWYFDADWRRLRLGG
jgi:DNA-binding CsgD family transcriptional regulator